MKSLVINSWLAVYGDPDEIDESKIFLRDKVLDILEQRKIRFVIVHGNQLHKKLWDYHNLFNASDYETKRYFKKLIQDIKHNEDIVALYYDFQVPDKLENEIEDLLPEPNDTNKTNYYKDRFLFEAAYLSTERIIITTDTRLKDKFANQNFYRIVLLEEFINEHEKLIK